MKNWIIIVCLIGTSVTLKSQEVRELNALALDFSWDSNWSVRYDYQVISPRDSSIVGKLTKVSASFWQKEIYDVEGNWLDTYRFIKNKEGKVSISKGGSIMDDRYYKNDLLQKRLLAKNGRLNLEWYLDYNTEGKLQRFSSKDSLNLKEKVFLYDSQVKVSRVKNFINGNLEKEDHYVYDKQGDLIQLYSLNANQDSIAKTDFIIESGQIQKKISFQFVDSHWALISKESCQFLPADKLKSKTLLNYSPQGNCINSHTANFNANGL